jgi:hypothetical protein
MQNRKRTLDNDNDIQDLSNDENAVIEVIASIIKAKKHASLNQETSDNDSSDVHQKQFVSRPNRNPSHRLFQPKDIEVVARAASRIGFIK